VPRRFLLDQNFPNPAFNVEELDANVTYAHISAVAPELTRTGTPDWMIYLEASGAHFDGVVTRDASQAQQIEELVALHKTTLTLVTWRRKIEDPVLEWGQLLAYMPQVLAQMSDPRPRIIFLPAPRLDRASVVRPDALIHREAGRQGMSFPQLQATTLARMREEPRLRDHPQYRQLLE
jgi:hypothetical protein